MSTIVDGQAGITFSDSSNQPVAGYTGFRNRIINGAMVIDQRNSGAAQSSLANYTYMVDRWVFTASQNGKFNSQQNAGSVTPPPGFINYLGLTVASAVSIASGDYFFINQRIEGLNMSDLAWGTSSARSVTLSFWAYSSLTGLFGGAVQNGTPNYSYVFTYNITSANTWTYVTVTIPGPTAGTWATNNTIGIQLSFNLGIGIGLSISPGSWQSGNTPGATGALSVVGTAGATFYITGVQFEKSGAATPFEIRQYGTEFALCQRYLYKLFCDSSTSNTFFMQGAFTASSGGLVGTNFPQRMRTVPVLYQEGSVSSFALYAPNGGAYNALSSLSLNAVTSTTYGLLNCGISSGGTAGQVAWLAANSQTSYGLGFFAEL